MTVLDDIFSKLIKEERIDTAKKLIDNVLKFMAELWNYGIHEKTFKFYSGYGILGKEIVLIDFGEMTNELEKVKKQIMWRGPSFEYLRKSYTDDLIDYFLEQKEKILTIEILERNWNIFPSTKD